jgi:hypothetical protein
MIALFMLASLTSPAFQTNASLSAECVRRTPVCAGYLEGVSDLLASLNGMKGLEAYYCPRPFTNPEEIRAAYVAWVDAHPEGADYSAATTVSTVLHNQFPCKI